MLLKLKLRFCNAFWVLELCKTLGKYLNAFLQKSVISLTNEGFKQKIFGVKPHRLDPSLTTVYIEHTKPCPLSIAHCTVRKLHIAHCTLKTLDTAHCTAHYTLSTLYTAQCKLNKLHTAVQATLQTLNTARDSKETPASHDLERERGNGHTALHCTTLHCTALHCTALLCTALHCTALHCTALHFRVLHCHCIAVHSPILHFTALHCIRLHYPTLLLTTLPHPVE